jgi:hypothetical protein
MRMNLKKISGIGLMLFGFIFLFSGLNLYAFGGNLGGTTAYYSANMTLQGNILKVDFLAVAVNDVRLSCPGCTQEQLNDPNFQIVQFVPVTAKVVLVDAVKSYYCGTNNGIITPRTGCEDLICDLKTTNDFRYGLLDSKINVNQYILQSVTFDKNLFVCDSTYTSGIYQMGKNCKLSKSISVALPSQYYLATGCERTIPGTGDCAGLYTGCKVQGNYVQLSGNVPIGIEWSRLGTIENQYQNVTILSSTTVQENQTATITPNDQGQQDTGITNDIVKATQSAVGGSSQYVKLMLGFVGVICGFFLWRRY